MKPVSFDDYRSLAKRRLPRALFEYVDRGTEGEAGLRALRRAFDDLRIVPAVLVDAASPDVAATLFGRRHALPFVIAPTAVAGLLRHDGETLLARAAAASGIPFCVATQSIYAIEHIAAGAPGAELWFQLYVWKDRELTWQLLDRVAQCGVETLLLTVDTPMSPKREYNIRNGFGIPLLPTARLAIDLLRHPRWLATVLCRHAMADGIPTYAHYPAAFRTRVTRAAVAENVALARGLDWDDAAALRRRWRGNFILKGILSPGDARKAVDIGVDGIVVSSHGGRNLDSAVTPLDMLPRIAEAVAGRVTLLADSGVRRGSDAGKLLACGADAVLLGRAPLYGVAAGGEAGACDMIALLAEELRLFMTFSGSRSVADLRTAELCQSGAGSDSAP